MLSKLWYNFLSHPVRIILFPLVNLVFLVSRYEVQIFSVIYKTQDVSKAIIRLLILIIHRLGVALTALLLMLSSSILIYTFLLEFSYKLPQLHPYYEILIKFFENKATWAAATTIVGTTVALGHLWNYEVNKNRFDAEQRDRFSKAYKEKLERMGVTR